MRRYEISRMMRRMMRAQKVAKLDTVSTEEMVFFASAGIAGLGGIWFGKKIADLLKAAWKDK